MAWYTKSNGSGTMGAQITAKKLNESLRNDDSMRYTPLNI